MTVRENGIHRRPVQDIAEYLEGQACDANEASFSLLNHPAERGNGFAHHLVQRAEFDVVTLNQIDVVDLEPAETFVDAGRHPLGREIKLRLAIPSNLGGHIEIVAWYFLERLAQNRLRPSHPVVRGAIDEVDAKVNSCKNGADCFALVDFPEDPAQR